VIANHSQAASRDHDRNTVYMGKLKVKFFIHGGKP